MTEALFWRMEAEHLKRECTRTRCEHREASGSSFHGHCSHASCPNYMNACPQHQDPQGRLTP